MAVEKDEIDQIDRVPIDVLNALLCKLKEDCSTLSKKYEEADMQLKNMCMRFNELTRELKEMTSLNNESLQKEIESLKVVLRQKEMTMQRKEEE